MEKRWLRPSDAAIYLSIATKTIYSLAARGALPACKIGGSVRIDKLRLDELLKDRTHLIEEEVEAFRERLR